MSTSDESADPVDMWTGVLQELGREIEEEQGEMPDLEGFSVRELANGDYVISTPGHTYNLSEESFLQHEKGRSKEGYNKLDEELEEKLEEELEDYYSQ